MASHFGSLENIFGGFPREFAIKTGTAERGATNPVTGEAYDDYSWMISYFPYDDPKIAIAAVIFQGGSGANCAPIIREVAGEYLKLQPKNETIDESNLDENGTESTGQGETLE